MDKCAACGYDRFWIYPDKVVCQNCGATQYKMVFVEQADKACPVCTKSLANKRSDAIFCSDGCRQKWHRAQHSGHWQNCQYCGKGFHSKRPAKYCSARCRKAGNRVRKHQVDVSDVPVIYVGDDQP